MNIHIPEAKSVLADIFKKYSKDFDIKSIYIWGSILTPDYVAGKSDIDTIAIVHDSVPMSIEADILKELEGKIPEVDKFSLRFLYLSELNEGSIKGNLASYINARLLLSDFPNWMHVVGHEYSLAEFSLHMPTLDEALALQMKKASEKGWLDICNVSEKDNMYFLKNLAQSIYTIEKKKGFIGPFSYKTLREKASDREAAILAHIIESRERDWNYEIFLKYRNEYQQYINDILIP